MYLLTVGQHYYFETKVIGLKINWYLEKSSFYPVLCHKSGYMSKLYRVMEDLLGTTEIILHTGVAESTI